MTTIMNRCFTCANWVPTPGDPQIGLCLTTALGGQEQVNWMTGSKDRLITLDERTTDTIKTGRNFGCVHWTKTTAAERKYRRELEKSS